MPRSLSEKIDLPASIVLMGFVISWSSAQIFIYQILRNGVSVWDQNFYRYCCVMLMAWPMVIIKRRLRQPVPLPKSLWLAALIPALPAAVAQSVSPLALKYMEPGMMTLLSKQYVVWAALFGMFFFRDERNLIHSWRFWTGATLALAGSVGVILFKPEVSFQAEIIGVLLVLIFAVSWSAYGVCIRRITSQAAPLTGYILVNTYVFISTAAIAFIWGRPVQIAEISSQSWLLIVISSIVNLFLPHMGLYWVISRIGSTLTQTVTLATAFITALMSWLFYDELLTPFQWLSGLILISGATLTLLSQQDLKKS